MESLSCGHTYVHARFWLTFWYHVIFFVSLTDNARLAKHGHQVLPGTIYLLHQVPPIHPGRCMLEVLSQTLHYRVTHLSATHTPSQTRRKLKFPFCKHVAESEQKKKSLKTHLIQVIPSTPWNIKSERSKMRRELLHLQAMTGSAIQRQGERLCSRLVISLTHTFTTPLMLSKNDGVVNKKILAKTFTPCRTSTLHMGTMTANPVFPERVGGVRLTT